MTHSVDPTTPEISSATLKICRRKEGALDGDGGVVVIVIRHGVKASMPS